MKNFFQYIFKEYDKSQSYNHGTYDPWAVALVWIILFVGGFSCVVLALSIMALAIFYPISIPFIILGCLSLLLYKTISSYKKG